MNSINENIKENKIKNFIQNIIKSIKEKDNIINKNIINKYIDDKMIIKEESNLISFIEILINILNSGNNIIIPFLDLCPILIKSYINSDIDEDKELKYINIFKLLKVNSFINREYFYPIYKYFSDILYDMEKINENDKRLKKFNKVVELWKIFYDFDINKKELKDFNTSSYCFIGGGLKVNLANEINLTKNSFMTKISLNGDIIQNFNDNLILFKIGNDSNIELKLSEVNSLIKDDKIRIITLIFKSKKIILKVQENENNKIEENEIGKDITSLKEFYLLQNFYGQIKSFEFMHSEIDKNKNENILFYEVFEPYPMTDDGYLSHDSQNKQQEKEDKITKKDFKVEIQIINKEYIKINYINYLDENFDLINYIGGFTPLVPFIPLINGIYTNKAIININNVDKHSYMSEVLDYILYYFIKMVEKYQKKYSTKTKKYIKNYNFFVFSLLLQIDYQIFGIKINEEKKRKTQINRDKLFPFVFSLFDDEKQQLNSFIFSKLINSTKEELKILLNKEGKKDIDKALNRMYSKLTTPLIIKSTFPQLFRNIMKNQFIYNRFWSNKNLFFKDFDKPKIKDDEKNIDNNDNKNMVDDIKNVDNDNKNIDKKPKLKYKQLSNYTKNFQQPLLYPILDFDGYIPSFSTFKKENLFRHEFNQTFSYTFKFDEDPLTELIKKIEPLNKHENRVKCCLVKKIYHVKGEIIVIQRKITNTQFEIIFYSNSKSVVNANTCNKNENINLPENNFKIINSNNKEICYGSAFPCLEKDFNRKLLIKSKDIKFILIRNYYRRTSALEIFTYKSNKSYYFNFHEIINLKKPEKNIVLREVIENESFKKIVIKKEEIIIYINKNYESEIFPLFSDKLSGWDKKIDFLNNYDLLTIINLLSNRSFKDLYQYPIFPILYKLENILDKNKAEERDLGEHLGIQDLSDKSKSRKELIEESYNASKNDQNDLEDEENDDNSECLFNTHYSNPVYTCNFLIRIFPYSFSSIEYQGDGFDSANRLFYSIQRTMENTLSQKSDIREMIPEMYYLPDLYYNNNDLNFGALIDGTEIDTVYLKQPNEQPIEKYKYLSDLKNYFEFGKLKLNNWINLIFGINQIRTKDKRSYFADYMYIQFDEKDQNKHLNNPLIMQKFEFGIQPYKLFDNKFPELKDKSKYFTEIKNFNIKQFKEEHSIIKGDKNKCFQCEGYNNIYIDYIEIINKKIITNKKHKNNNDYKDKHWKIKDNYDSFFYYIFTGDVIGNITLYKYTKKNESNNNLNFKQIDKDTEEYKGDFYYKIKKITDHNKQIKYIDYNPRLNLFLSYSLDGFINIYIFPKCKLVRAIKVDDFTKSKEILEKVVLVSNPFPIIFTYDKNNMYTLTLNGELIKKEKIKDKIIEICPCIDKNCGLISDCIIIKKGENDKEELSLPLLKSNVNQ